MTAPLPFGVQRTLEAAEGWLELGDWKSADDEIKTIPSPYRSHPDVLRIRVETYSAANRWDSVIEVARVLVEQSPENSFGSIRLAYALHELKRTREAWNTLLPMAEKFPSQWVIPYNLACYAAQLGDLIEARDRLAQALKIGDAKALKKQAFDDPDLAPLW